MEAGDAVVFAKGVRESSRGGVAVTLLVPRDVTLSQIMPGLESLARAGEEAGHGHEEVGAA